MANTKENSQQRTKYVASRVTLEEYQAFRLLAAKYKMGIGDYLRKMINAEIAADKDPSQAGFLRPIPETEGSGNNGEVYSSKSDNTY